MSGMRHVRYDAGNDLDRELQIQIIETALRRRAWHAKCDAKRLMCMCAGEVEV